MPQKASSSTAEYKNFAIVLVCRTSKMYKSRGEALSCSELCRSERRMYATLFDLNKSAPLAPSPSDDSAPEEFPWRERGR